MIIRTTKEYERWIRKLKDLQAALRITRYFDRIARGNALTGDFKMVRPRVIEVRFDFGHGYRVYLTQRGKEILLLLVGGDKPSQERDIAKAVRLANEWRENEDEDV